MTRQLNAMHTGPRREDWETPPDLFGPLHREFGFTLDVCANERNAKCSHYYSADALSRAWPGVCWMNPPYGKQIDAWVRKAWEESQRGATVVCLIPARTDAGWWHDYAMRGEVRFIRRRVRFVGAPVQRALPECGGDLPPASRSEGSVSVDAARAALWAHLGDVYGMTPQWCPTCTELLAAYAECIREEERDRCLQFASDAMDMGADQSNRATNSWARERWFGYAMAGKWILDKVEALSRGTPRDE